MSRLKRSEFFRLTQWVLGKQELLLEDAPNYAILAHLAGKDLGIAISSGSVKECIDITGTKYNPKVLSGGLANKKHHIRLDHIDVAIGKMAVEIRQIQADLAIFRGVIRDGLGPLPGDPVKPSTMSVANGKY